MCDEINGSQPQSIGFHAAYCVDRPIQSQPILDARREADRAPTPKTPRRRLRLRYTFQGQSPFYQLLLLLGSIGL